MRYIIGCEIIDKQKLKHPDNPFIKDKGCKGIYAVDYFAFILDKNIPDRVIKVPVFDNLKEAQEAVSSLSKTYRRDDVAFYPQRKSRYIRHFYLLKLDSPKCPIKIDKNSKQTYGRSKYNYYVVKEMNFS